MSQDPDNKTEDATEKKLSDARAEGNLPLSRELSVAFALIGLTVAIAFTAESAIQTSSHLLARLFDHVGDIRMMRLGDAVGLHWALLLAVGMALVPSLAVLLFFGLLGSLLQRPTSLTPGRLAPDTSRISPVAGWARLFGVSGLLEFAKSLAKLALIGVLAFFIIRRQLANALDPMAMEPAQMLRVLRALSMPLLAGIAAGVAVIAGIDVVWVRRKWLASLRMTRQEVKDESRESQGDPMIKGRMRAMARQRARSRMMAAVPQASFIVTNPTHFRGGSALCSR